MIKEVKGNILEATEDVICHQVNCMGIMGGGLALQIKNKYYEAYVEYTRYCKRHQIPEQMLGVSQYIKCHDGKFVVNLFGQLYYGTNKQHTNYGALKNCLQTVYMRAKQYKESVALPYKLGCGLAGGDWNIVYKIIEEVFNDYDVTIYNFE